MRTAFLCCPPLQRKDSNLVDKLYEYTPPGRPVCNQSDSMIICTVRHAETSALVFRKETYFLFRGSSSQPFLSSDRPDFQTHKWYWNEQKFGHGSRNQELLRWRGPAAIYDMSASCYVQISSIPEQRGLPVSTPPPDASFQLTALCFDTRRRLCRLSVPLPPRNQAGKQDTAFCGYSPRI
jgi:hypothetical protein